MDFTRRNRNSVDGSGAAEFSFATPAARPRNGDLNMSIGDLSLNQSGDWSYLNNSSVSESPSSLSSSFGAVRSNSNRSSLRAHRGPYSRPSCLNQSLTRDNSRFSPQAKKPIFVGAKPVQAEPISTLPLLTTTAQKMMDILHKTATPVVDGNKVPINSPSLKPLKPAFTTQLQTNGPPIIRSAPDFKSENFSMRHPGVRPISSSTPSIPPSGVNSSSSTTLGRSVEPVKNTGGGKMKTIMPKNSRTNLYSTNRCHQNGIGEKSKAVVSAGRRQKRSFPFNAAWPLSKITDYVPPRKIIAAAAPAPLPITSAPASETRVTESKPKPNVPGSSQTLPALKLEPIPLPLPLTSAKGKEWECPSCMVFNMVSKPNCVCCAEPRPAGFAPETETSEKAEKPEPVASSSAFKFGFTAPPKVDAEAPAAGSTFFQFGAKTETTTDSLNKPSFGVGATPAPLPKNDTEGAVIEMYTCGDCWVSNKMTDPTCVCCGGARPAKYANKATNSKPEPVKTTPAFRFGIQTPSNEPALGGQDSVDNASVLQKQLLSFGQSVFPKPAETAKTESTSFQFGITQKAPEPQPTTPAPAFNFGITKETPPSYLKSPDSAGGVSEKAPVASKSQLDKYSFEPFSGGPLKRKNTDPVAPAGAKIQAFGSMTSSAPVPTPSLAAPAPIPIPAFNLGAPASSATSVSAVSTPVTSAPLVSTSLTTNSTPTPIVFGATAASSAPKVFADVPDQGAGGAPKRTREPTPEPNPKKPAFTFGSTPGPVAPIQNSAPAPSTPSLFTFGMSSASAAPIPAATPTPAPSSLGNLFNTPVTPAPAQSAPFVPAPVTPFNFNPGQLNLNFGAAAAPSAAPGAAPLFAFTATPTPTESGRRPIKKAHRRLR